MRKILCRFLNVDYLFNRGMLTHSFGGRKLAHVGVFGRSEYPLAEGAFIRRMRDAVNTEIERAPKVAELDVWSPIIAKHREIVDLLNNDETGAETYLNRMFATPLTHGLEQGDMVYRALLENSGTRLFILQWIVDRLVSLAEALGCVPVENPEQGESGKLVHSDPDALVDLIQQKLGIVIKPPTFQGSLFGLKTRHGVFSVRDFFALYETTRIADLCPDRNTVICEIGGGVGYLAYYCRLMGFKNFTIIDLPTVNVAQAYFLRKNLPDIELVLSGEEKNPFAKCDATKVLSTRFFKAAPKDCFDIVINVDSFPEMADVFVQDYLREMRRNARLFLSVNQEAMGPRSANSVQARVMDQIDKVGGFRRLCRYPFWMRKGYVEELYVVKRRLA